MISSAAHAKLVSFLAILFFASLVSAWSNQYVLPTSGQASTTQFYLGPELQIGTSCGASGWPFWPDGLPVENPDKGKGPGLLYAAVNQLAFGANPSATNAGGAGAACGVCFRLTPISNNNTLLVNQTLTFMIVDECPASATPSVPFSGPSAHCGQCKMGDMNDYGKQWHFDIAIDAMNQQQYNTFFNGVTDGSNWKSVSFVQTTCSNATNPDPPVKDWGCMNGCKNENVVDICAEVC